MKTMTRAKPLMMSGALLLMGGMIAGPAMAATHPARATAGLTAADGTDKGTAEIIETPKGLDVTIHAYGLKPGTHAAHVHTTGICTPPAFTSAGGHWNPTHRQHGMDNPEGMHMGDMPNMEVGADGTGELKFTIPGGKLTKGPNALFDADGAAVVIHGGPDDMRSDPAGNAGPRVACGVLSLAS